MKRQIRSNLGWIFWVILLSLLVVSPLMSSLVKAQEEPKSDDISFQPSTLTISEPSPLVPWSIFWKKLKAISYWRLQWLNETGNVWQRHGLQVIRTHPYSNMTKIGLNFTSTEGGSYRLDFAIERTIKAYVNKSSNWRYELRYNYEDDRERSYLLIFDWSDIKDISGLIIKHGVKNDYFWFRIRRDNVPANYNVLLDPSLIVDQDNNYATQEMNQIKTFRNPIGLKYRYAMFFFQNTSASIYELRMYKSESGTTWTNDSTIHDFGSSSFEGASLWIYDNSTFLIVYTLYVDTNGNLYFRNGTITNSEHSITWDTEETIITGAANLKAKNHVITMGEDGYIWLLYEKGVGYTSQTLNVDSFNYTTQGWTEVGVSPWLNASADGNYIYVKSGNSIHEWFSFDDLSNGSPLGHLSSISLRVLTYQEAGGNDKIEPTVTSLGTTKTYSQQAPPTSVYGTVTWDISDLFAVWTTAKIDDLEFSLKKISVQSSQWVYVDRANVRVSLTPYYDVKVIASEQPYNVSSWGSEYTIYDSEADGGTWGARTPISIAPFEETRDMMVVYTWFKTSDLKRHLHGLEMNWDGSTFNEYVNVDLSTQFPSGTPRLRTAVGTDNQAHVIFQTIGNIYHVNWTMAFPFGWDTVTSLGVPNRPTSTSIDKTTSPNVLYVFYRETASGNFSYKTSPTDSISWSSRTQIKDDSEPLNFFSASYEDYGDVISLIYTTSTTFKVRYFEVSLITQYSVTFYFYTGGTLLVNGTNRNNGTSTDYNLNQVLNITGVANYQYVFQNHTYDASSTTDNPFYLTVTQDYTTHTYFRFLFDPVYIGINNTLAGNPTRFSSDWTDLNVAEGLSHFRFSTNNTGTWQNDTWDTSWVDTVWAVKTKTLNSTVGLTVSFRFFVNNTDGYVYASTISFFNTQVTGFSLGFGLGFILTLMIGIVFALAGIVVVSKKRG